MVQSAIGDNKPGDDSGMLDPSPFRNAGKRTAGIEAGIQRQTGWNPVRDAQLPGLAEEVARRRGQLAEARAAWAAAPERRHFRLVGMIVGICGVAAALPGYFGLVPGFAGLAIGFALRGGFEANRRLIPGGQRIDL